MMLIAKSIPVYRDTPIIYKLEYRDIGEHVKFGNDT